MQLDRIRVEQEEKRKTLAAETQQHQKVYYRELKSKQKNNIFIGHASLDIKTPLCLHVNDFELS